MDAATPGDGEVFIDPDTLANLERYGGSRLVACMIREVLASAEQRVDAIRTGWLAGDALGVRRAAHSLKGSAAIVGARTLHDLAARLEHSAAVPEEPLVASLVEALHDAYGRTRTRLLEALHASEP
jgi:HPt (histidine-containing phosphotransfer) domain-containing protein